MLINTRIISEATISVRTLLAIIRADMVCLAPPSFNYGFGKGFLDVP